jgi:toxin ParE1/3/4
LEFAKQIDYYDEREAGLGQRFYREVIGCLNWISVNPTVPRFRKTHRRVNLKVFPFYIAYVTQGDLVWVLAVAHGNKKPGYWRDRI